MKARTCTQQIAADIQKFGLVPVQQAVEMATALLTIPTPKKRTTGAGKTRVAVAAASAEIPERFDR